MTQEMPATPYPLQWPAGRPRTPSHKRRAAKFGKRSRYAVGPLTIAEAISRLQNEADRLGARYAVLSSNLELRLDGLPRSNQREPADTGVSLYFQLAGKPHCIACDRWNRTADNIAAIAAHIAALRGIERWGCGSTEEAFAGFQALPPPGHVHQRPWREVLHIPVGVKPTFIALRDIYHLMAKTKHPDSGGSDAQMAELNEAYKQAKIELGFES